MATRIHWDTPDDEPESRRETIIYSILVVGIIAFLILIPIYVYQHIPPNSLSILAEQLNNLPFKLK